MREEERFSRKQELTYQHNTLIFDLRINTLNEQLPERIIRCLKLTRINTKEVHNYLPRYKELTRNGANVFLKQDLQPVMLRSIIGNRKMMYEQGADIIINLLKGMLALEREGIVLQNI